MLWSSPEECLNNTQKCFTILVLNSSMTPKRDKKDNTKHRPAALFSFRLRNIHTAIVNDIRPNKFSSTVRLMLFILSLILPQGWHRTLHCIHSPEAAVVSEWYETDKTQHTYQTIIRWRWQQASRSHTLEGLESTFLLHVFGRIPVTML